MKSFALAALAFAGSVLAVSSPVSPNNLKPRATLEPITVKGNAFFKGSERFYIRGVDYQPGGPSSPIDPLADTDVCTRDIAEFKKLGTNVVRVYIVDNSADHSTCMQLLADAGIYLVLDASTPNYSINRGDPGPSYNAVYLQSVFATIDVFAQYTNTLAFFSGNVCTFFSIQAITNTNLLYRKSLTTILLPPLLLSSRPRQEICASTLQAKDTVRFLSDTLLQMFQKTAWRWLTT